MRKKDTKTCLCRIMTSLFSLLTVRRYKKASFCSCISCAGRLKISVAKPSKIIKLAKFRPAYFFTSLLLLISHAQKSVQSDHEIVKEPMIEQDIQAWQKSILIDRFKTPYNISVTMNSWNRPTVSVNWSFSRSFDQEHLIAFRITYIPQNSRYRYIQEVPAYLNSTNIDNLLPNTKYMLKVSAITDQNANGYESQEVIFVTPVTILVEGTAHGYESFTSVRIRLDTEDNVNMKPAEVMVVAAILGAWMGVISLFIKKWGKIRTLEPNRAARVTSSSVTNLDTRSAVAVAAAAVAAGSGGTGGSICAGFAHMNNKTRLQSFANITSIPKLQMSDSVESFGSQGWPRSCSARPRINSVFLTSPSRRSSLLQLQTDSLPRRYKSAEDLQNLVMQITEKQREARKNSNCSIRDDVSRISCPRRPASAICSRTSCLDSGPLLTETARAFVAAGCERRKSAIGRTGSAYIISGQAYSSQDSQSQRSGNEVSTEATDHGSLHSRHCLGIPGTYNEIDSRLGVNCSYCRRRMSRGDFCTHCSGGDASNGRHVALMQSTSFLSHRGSFSSEGSFDSGAALCTGNQKMSH